MKGLTRSISPVSSTDHDEAPTSPKPFVRRRSTRLRKPVVYNDEFDSDNSIELPPVSNSRKRKAVGESSTQKRKRDKVTAALISAPKPKKRRSRVKKSTKYVSAEDLKNDVKVEARLIPAPAYISIKEEEEDISAVIKELDFEKVISMLGEIDGKTLKGKKEDDPDWVQHGHEIVG